jgi:hypothetical protein
VLVVFGLFGLVWCFVVMIYFVCFLIVNFLSFFATFLKYNGK